MNKPELYTIREAMELLGKISRNSIYSLLRDGRLASLKIGRRRFIPPHAIKDFVDASTNTDSPSATSRSKRATQFSLRLVPVRKDRGR